VLEKKESCPGPGREVSVKPQEGENCYAQPRAGGEGDYLGGGSKDGARRSTKPGHGLS